METSLRALMVDVSTGYYRINRYPVGEFFGPVDLGLHLAGKHNSLNFGVGLLAGSIFPGSNRLVFTGFSPCWGGFFISSMGGAGLAFENVGINLIAIRNCASRPSILQFNRSHGEEIEVELHPVDTRLVWDQGRQGVYSMMDHIIERCGSAYETDPRVLAVGPASETTDIGAICSAPVRDGQLSFVDTWAGRGGLGSKMLREHGIAGVIYGGTVLDEDFRDRNVADQWFQDRYEKKLVAKDVESTVKYRFDPKFETGGTFGVNYATVGGSMLSFNYSSIYLNEDERVRIHRDFVTSHYLKQFNEETIRTKQQKTCGEPCVAVCKKMHGEFKKDYEPYQTMGPLAGVFDQRAAEQLTHHADTLGFDAISAGGVVSWLMECVSHGVVTPAEVGVEDIPKWDPGEFDVVESSLHNAGIGVGILDAMVENRGVVDLSEGARKLARRLSRARGNDILDRFVFAAFGRKGWMVPNQYWTPGVLSPMPIMGKYYMHYGKEFLTPRELGRANASRMKKELIMDNIGLCRFHRAWAEEMIPDIVGSLFGKKLEYETSIAMTASRINSRNASVFWESERTMDYVSSFLERKHEVEGDDTPALLSWIDRFRKDKREAALDYWYDIHKGIQESLREF